MLRAVFDTVIFVRALLDSHSLAGRLIFEHLEDYQLILSPEVIEEILEVLGRREIIERFHLRNTNYPKAMARLIKSMNRAEIIQIGQIQPISRDPNDDKFLATAKMGKCEYLVTEDEDLLVLKEYKGIEIINTSTFIDILNNPQKIDREANNT